jgi:hypothetical protein
MVSETIVSRSPVISSRPPHSNCAAVIIRMEKDANSGAFFLRHPDPRVTAGTGQRKSGARWEADARRVILTGWLFEMNNLIALI